MTRARMTVHASVVVLFLIAVTFYFLGAATSATVFGVLGVITEIAAWITWFGRSSDRE